MAWLTGWSYRKSHAIAGQVGAGTDYQLGIKVYFGAGADGTETVDGVTFGKVYCDSKCESDFGDIRFTDNDGDTLLTYWLKEKVDDDYAIFYVTVDDDLDANVTIYVYYGKAAETTTSTEGREDLDTDYAPNEVDPNNRIGYVGDFEVDWDAWENENAYCYKDFGAGYFKGNIVNFEAKIGAGNNAVGWGIGFSNQLNPKHLWTHYSSFALYMRLGKERVYIEYKTGGAALSDFNEDLIVTGTWYYFTLFISDTEIVLKHWNNAARAGVPTDTLTVARAVDDDYRYFYICATFNNGQADNVWYYFRNIHIRKYVDAEPVHGAWGAEESLGAIVSPSIIPLMEVLEMI